MAEEKKKKSEGDKPAKKPAEKKPAAAKSAAKTASQKKPAAKPAAKKTADKKPAAGKPAAKKADGESKAAKSKAESKPKTATKAKTEAKSQAKATGKKTDGAKTTTATKAKSQGAASKKKLSAKAQVKADKKDAAADGPLVVRARARYVRTAPRKARLVIDHIRGRKVGDARTILQFTQRHAARDVSKVLESAIANAEHNHELDPEDLIVAAAYVDEGPTLKRWQPRARGRASQILKRTSHITVEVTEARVKTNSRKAAA